MLAVFDFLLAAHHHLPLLGMTWTELWDVTDGEGYAFWSGFGSDLGEVTLVGLVATGIGTFWHKHNCHEHRCLRLSWHPDENGHPVCKKHHKDHPSRGLWWAIKHFVKTGQLGDHDHPRHNKHVAAQG